MLLSFVVYTGLALILSFLGWHISQRESHIIRNGGKELPFYSWEILVSLIVFAIISGMRYKTGYDSYMYMSQYIQLRDFGGFSRDTYEPGFVCISQVFASLKAHTFFYFAFWAILQLGFFYYGFRNRKFLYAWIPLVLVLSCYYIAWMNSIRQAVCECVFVAMLPLVVKRKRLYYVLLVSLILATIHKSALLIVVYSALVLLLDKIHLQRRTILTLFIFCVLLGVYPIWLKLFLWIPKLLSMMGYEKYSDMALGLIDGDFRFVNFGPAHIISIAVCIIAIYIYPEVKKKWSSDTLIKPIFNLAFVGVCLEQLFINTTHVVLRPLEYMTIFMIPVMAYVVHYLFTEKKYILFALTLMLVCVPIYLAVLKAIYSPSPVTLPYLYDIMFLHK